MCQEIHHCSDTYTYDENDTSIYLLLRVFNEFIDMMNSEVETGFEKKYELIKSITNIYGLKYDGLKIFKDFILISLQKKKKNNSCKNLYKRKLCI